MHENIVCPNSCPIGVHSFFFYLDAGAERGGEEGRGGGAVVRRANVGELRGKTSAAEGLRENGSQGENNGWCDSHAWGDSSVLCACRSLNS